MKVVFILVLIFMTCSIGLGQAKSDNANKMSADEQALIDLANKWLEADAKADAPTVNLIIAEEFSFLNGNNRMQYLATMNPDRTLTVESAVVEDPKIQIYGETAIVSGINSYRFKKDGRPIIAKLPSMTVWVKRSGRWQCVKACTLPPLAG